MKKKPAPKAAPETQHERFIKVAGELGCDDDEAAFEEKLKRIAAQKPKPPKNR